MTSVTFATPCGIRSPLLFFVTSDPVTHLAISLSGLSVTRGPAVTARRARVVSVQVLQLYQITQLHHGLMMVGPSGSGKSCAWRVLLKVRTGGAQSLRAAAPAQGLDIFSRNAAALDVHKTKQPSHFLVSLNWQNIAG